MCVARKVYFKSTLQALCLVMTISIFEFNCFKQNKHRFVMVSGIENINLFRFQNFEPRAEILQQTYPFMSYTTNNISTASAYKVNKEFRETFDEQVKPKREGRGIYLQASDTDVIVETEFIVPFVNIPIMWSTNIVKVQMRKLLNLHTGALLWSGAFVAVGAIIAGVVNTIIALKPALTTPSSYKQTRGLTNENVFWKDNTRLTKVESTSVVDLLDAKLHEHNINLKSCVQRSICHYIKRTENDIRAGSASSSQKILLGVLRAQNLRRFMHGTAVFTAIEAGHNLGCEILEHHCKLPKFETKSFVRLIKNYFKSKLN